MIHNIEDKTQKELVEIVKIQMEEYAKLNKLFEAADKAHTEIESQWFDVKQKLEAAERERDEFGNAFLQLKDELYSCAQCGNGIECKDFDIFNGGIVDDLLNKFAIEQRISGIQRVLDCRELNLSEGDVATISLMQKQLRQQLNGGE